MAREGQTRRVSKRNRKSNQRHGEGIKGGRGGIVQGPTRVGRRRERGWQRRTGWRREGGGKRLRLHTPPRGLPHSDSPIRMSK